PSGDHCGELSASLPGSRARGSPPPAAATSQILFTPVWLETKASQRPSGENCGSLMRLALVMEISVSGIGASSAIDENESATAPSRIASVPAFLFIASAPPPQK